MDDRQRTTTVPAGWYPDPSGASVRRYWDGRGWTGYVQQYGGPQAPPGGQPQQPPAAPAAPADTSAAKRIDYLGATESELRNADANARAFVYRSPRERFPHHGILGVETEALVLTGWCAIPRTAIQRVDVTFTSAYTRSMAGSYQGGRNLNFGFFGSVGKPLVLTLSPGEPVYLLLGWHYLSGINHARAWAPEIKRWIARQAPS